MSDVSYIDRNLQKVKKELTAATASAVQIVAAVKYATDEELLHLLSIGVDTVGENRVQQLLAREEIYRRHGTHVHFIGTLQTNKVRQIVDKVEMIHSVDSLHLAQEIEKRAGSISRTISVLVEINGAGEESKSGISIEEAEALAREIDAMPHLSLCGFMTMGPRFETDAEYRAYFKKIREAATVIWHAIGKEGKPLLSMGMSESAAAAAAEGADLVRVGRRLFEGRPDPET